MASISNTSTQSCHRGRKTWKLLTILEASAVQSPKWSPCLIHTYILESYTINSISVHIERFNSFSRIYSFTFKVKFFIHHCCYIHSTFCAHPSLRIIESKAPACLWKHVFWRHYDAKQRFSSLNGYTLGILKNVLYGEAPPGSPTPYPFIYHFWQERYPFRIPCIEEW